MDSFEKDDEITKQILSNYNLHVLFSFEEIGKEEIDENDEQKINEFIKLIEILKKNKLKNILRRICDQKLKEEGEICINIILEVFKDLDDDLNLGYLLNKAQILRPKDKNLHIKINKMIEEIRDKRIKRTNISFKIDNMNINKLKRRIKNR